jgi:hypothetical protein
MPMLLKLKGAESPDEEIETEISVAPELDDFDAES